MRLRVVLPSTVSVVGETFRVLVRRIDVEVSLRADDPVWTDVGGIEARDERGHALSVETEQRAGRFVDLRELRAAPLLTEIAMTSFGSARNR